MRATEFITEYRNRLLQYVKSLLPTWPEYVLKDWLVPNKGDFSNLPDTELKNGIMEKLQGAGLTPDTKWQLVPDMKFTMDMFDPMTKQRLIGRAGGKSDLGMQIPRDAERHATQAALAQQQGGVRKEPVLLIKMPNGYELLEGWHRTIQHFAQYPEGYTGPAWVAVAQGQQGVAEGTEQKPVVIYTNHRGATIDDDIKKSLRTTQEPFNKLQMWEKHKSMKDPKIADWVTNKLLPELKQNGVLKPLLVWNNNGQLFVIDGNHRFLAYQEAGYRGRVPVQIVPDNMIIVSDTVPGQQGVAENFADGKNPGRKGLSKRVGIPKKATLGKLEKIAQSSTGERRRMAQWQLNMRRGKKK